MSSLIKKLGLGLAGFGLIGSLALTEGCGSIRQGDEQISYALIPFVGIATKHETFKEGTNEILSEMELFATAGGFDIKHYGENRVYNGMYKVKIQRGLGEIKIFTETYDAKGKLIRREEGISGDIPLSLKKKYIREDL